MRADTLGPGWAGQRRPRATDHSGQARAFGAEDVPPDVAEALARFGVRTAPDRGLPASGARCCVAGDARGIPAASPPSDADQHDRATRQT